MSRVARTFEAIANAYDANGVDFFGPIAAALVDRLDLVSGQRVLDVGCGKGAVLVHARAKMGSAARLVGIDVSPVMLAEARDSLLRQGLEDVELQQMDGQTLEFDPGSFDVIASSLVLFFMPDPPRALASWRRVLTDSGQVGITTFGPRDETWRALDSVFDPFIPPGLLDARTSGERGHFEDDDSIAALFAAAGFTTVHTTHVAIPVEFESFDQWREFSMSTGQRAMWAAVPPDELPGVVSAARRCLSDAADVQGVVRVHQDVRVTTAGK